MKIQAILLLALTCILFGGITVAYDDQTTHPALTQEIVRLHNLGGFGEEITNQQMEWIIEGSIEEDTPPRWVNHFYDPVQKQGWEAERLGFVHKEILESFSRFALSSEKPLSAIEWAKSRSIQEAYARYGGDRTWQKALEYYAEGNEKEAYRTLGHVLHLLEDLSVPDHTRGDTHAHVGLLGDNGSPYEDYARQWNRMTIRDLLIPESLVQDTGWLPLFENFEAYLEAIAKYSNHYFFSKDTILDENYFAPGIVTEDLKYAYGLDEYGKKFPLARRVALVDRVGKLKEDYAIASKEDEEILRAYFSRLSREVIRYGAGLILLFQKESGEAIVNREFPTRLVKYDTAKITPPIISPFGEVVKAKNDAKAFLGEARSAIAGFLDRIGPPHQTEFNLGPASASNEEIVSHAVIEAPRSDSSTTITLSDAVSANEERPRSYAGVPVRNTDEQPSIPAVPTPDAEPVSEPDPEFPSADAEDETNTTISLARLQWIAGSPSMVDFSTVEEYPFWDSRDRSDIQQWKLVVFYLNHHPQPQEFLSTAQSLVPEDPNVLELRYPMCNGAETNTSVALLIPHNQFSCQHGGPLSNAYKFANLEDERFQVEVTGPGPFSSGDFFTAAFYEFDHGGAGEQVFRLKAIDPKEYRFADVEVPAFEPGAPAELTVEFDSSRMELRVAWFASSDADSLDSTLIYQTNYSTDILSGDFDEGAWRTAPNRLNATIPVEQGNSYHVGVRAVDSQGNASAAVTTLWNFPSGFTPLPSQFNHDVLVDDLLGAQKIVLAQPATLAGVRMWIASSGGAFCCSNTRLSILSDEGGAPGSPIAASNLVNIRAIDLAAEVDYKFSDPVSLPLGSYWLAPAHISGSNRINVYGSRSDSYTDGTWQRNGINFSQDAYFVTY